MPREDVASRNSAKPATDLGILFVPNVYH